MKELPGLKGIFSSPSSPIGFEPFLTAACKGLGPEDEISVYFAGLISDKQARIEACVKNSMYLLAAKTALDSKQPQMLPRIQQIVKQRVSDSFRARDINNRIEAMMKTGK